MSKLSDIPSLVKKLTRSECEDILIYELFQPTRALPTRV